MIHAVDRIEENFWMCTLAFSVTNFSINFTVCVCMYVYMYVCIYIYIYIYVQAHTHTHTHTIHIYVGIYIYIYIVMLMSRGKSDTIKCFKNTLFRDNIRHYTNCILLPLLLLPSLLNKLLSFH